MKFAVNYSTPLRQLIQTGQVRVDLLKCPEWHNIVNAALEIGSVYIHFEVALGNNKVQRLNFDLIKRMMDLTGTQFLNTHLSNLRTEIGMSKQKAKEVYARWQTDLEFIREKLPGTTVIAENLPWHASLPEIEQACDPELITKFLIENEVGLLLDLSHAQISALKLGIPYREYVARLPVDRLAELHVTGIREYAGYMTDHFEIQAYDWEIMEWAATQIRTGVWKEPEIVAFEYGGIGDVFCWRTEKPALLDQIPLLYELFGQQSG